MTLFFTASNVIIEEETITPTVSPFRIVLFCILIVLLLIYCFVYDYKNKVKKGKAYAKVNLFLNILNKRKDGYHNLNSVFDFIDLYDEIKVIKSNTFKLICNDKVLESEDNIIYKAYLKLKETFPHIKGVKVYLKKNIPKEAGLGGGSADCAKFISLMGDLYDLSLTNKVIHDICPKLGADVLPCYFEQTLLANGIGDEITLIKSKLNYYLVIIKPDFSCSTKEMYSKLDKKKRVEKKTIIKLVTALEDNDYDCFSKYLYNDFEKVVDIKNIQDDLKECGASNSLLAGSGSCVFGVFKSYTTAQKAYYNLSKKYQCYFCQNKRMD